MIIIILQLILWYGSYEIYSSLTLMMNSYLQKYTFETVVY